MAYDNRNSVFLDCVVFLGGVGATSVTLYGMTQHVGRTVSAFIVGLDVGDYVVASDGSITVPYGSDVDGLFTAARIIACSAENKNWGRLATQVTISAVNYTVPACVGFRYTSQGQTLRPYSAAEAKTTEGTALAKKRRIDQVGALVQNTVGVSFGTDFNNLYPATFAAANGSLLDHATLFSGVWRDTVSDDSSYDGMICWQITGAYPTTIVSLTGFMHVEEPG